MVLLKNSPSPKTGRLVLPLAKDGSIRTVAVLGDDGCGTPYATGHGSGHVIPPYIVRPLDAITARFGSTPRSSPPLNPALTFLMEKGFVIGPPPNSSDPS